MSDRLFRNRPNGWALALALVCFGLATTSCSGGIPTAPAELTSQAAGPRFSAVRAIQLVVSQVNAGPRLPGSPGHADVRKLIGQVLQMAGATVREITFQGTQGVGNGVTFVNIEGRMDATTGSATAETLLIGAHYDTLPHAYLDPDPAKRSFPIQGANDGASGVAVALELATVMQGRTRPRNLRFLFFDGEDFETGEVNMFYGSRHYAASIPAGEKPAIAGLILLDMIGDADLRIPQEAQSKQAAPALLARVYAMASAVGSTPFVPAVGPSVLDDHVPFINAGIPAIDLIDFEYPAWHTTADDLNHVSGTSLYDVGRVLEAVLIDPLPLK